MSTSRSISNASITLICSLLIAAPACVEPDEAEDGPDDGFASGKADGAAVVEGSDEALAVLRLVNNASFQVLDVDVALSSTAAKNITAHRRGPDGVEGTDDDRVFETLAQLDAIPYVGPVALDRMLAHATAISLPAWNAAKTGVFMTLPGLKTTCHSADADGAGDNCQAWVETTFRGRFLFNPSGPLGWEAGVLMLCRGYMVEHTGAFRVECGGSSCDDRFCQSDKHRMTGVLGDQLVVDTFEGSVRRGNQAYGWKSRRWELASPTTVPL